ncbi:hypothetical protein [Dongia sp.]|uniref:hypothetical protein n=1 Tax=Dongia sp. TaxID=1977262 RepID=UPI0035B0B100
MKSHKSDQDMNAPERSGDGKSNAGQLEPSDIASLRSSVNGASSNGNSAHQVRPVQTLDRWFDDQLNRLFNDVSSEPLPPDLAKLIGQLKKRSDR